MTTQAKVPDSRPVHRPSVFFLDTPILPIQPKPPQARRPAERRPRTYFRCRVRLLPIALVNPPTFNAEQPLVLRSWCGAKRIIMQNKPNFQKTKIALNPLLEMTYEKMAAADDPKNKPNRTQFSILAPSQSRIPHPRITSHGLRSTTYDFAKQTQFGENEKRT